MFDIQLFALRLSQTSVKTNPTMPISIMGRDSSVFLGADNPKIFFRLNKSLDLFETHCAFLPLFNPNIDLLQVVKVTKSGHHLSHDRASKGYGSTPCLTSQTSLYACLQRLNTMQISL